MRINTKFAMSVNALLRSLYQHCGTQRSHDIEQRDGLRLSDNDDDDVKAQLMEMIAATGYRAHWTLKPSL